MHPFYQWVEIVHRARLPWIPMLSVEFFLPIHEQIIGNGLKHSHSYPFSKGFFCRHILRLKRRDRSIGSNEDSYHHCSVLRSTMFSFRDEK